MQRNSWLLGLVLVIAQAAAWAHGTDDARVIVQVMKKQFDRPDAPLQVAPVTVVDGYAVAGWLQTSKGGRALLQKNQGAWTIAVCAGDGLKEANTLESTGMSAVTAQKLAKAVAAAESRLSAGTRQRFASFEGLMKIDGANAGSHGAHHAPAVHAPDAAGHH